MPDRAPFVGLANNAYVMPAGLGDGLPITSVNANTAELQIYRIGDRAVAAAVRDGIFQGNLTDYAVQDIAASQPDPSSNGFTLICEYFLPDGTSIDPPQSEPIAQN
ncbi:MAG: hypothetical protein MO846_06660 [Candidatus Devosia symbiotica]|nr:hypothetical protein [Candidatus Devosia symbiotica]